MQTEKKVVFSEWVLTMEGINMKTFTETDYILSSENNKDRLEESIAQYNNGSVVVKSVVELNKSNEEK